MCVLYAMQYNRNTSITQKSSEIRAQRRIMYRLSAHFDFQLLELDRQSMRIRENHIFAHAIAIVNKSVMCHNSFIVLFN